MKKMIFITLCGLLSLNCMQAKNIPNWVQNRLDSVKKETERSLKYYRLWYYEKNGNMTLPNRLGDFYAYTRTFTDKEIKLIDSLKLNLSVRMVYDNEMCNRIVQLLRNEYQDWELDSLVNRSINFSSISLEREARKSCRFDTLQIFKTALDSFYTDLKNRNPEDSILIKYEYAEKYQYEPEIFKMLKLDTTIAFKQAHNKIVLTEKTRVRKEYEDIQNTYNIDTYLVELCGYIGDKRFVRPLIDMLNMAEEDHQKEKIVEALVRMQIEPYYTNYVKKRTLTTEQIHDKNWLSFNINDFVYVLGTQDAFLELSKYLLSDKPYTIAIIDYEDHTEAQYSPVSIDAFNYIQYNIENKEVQEMIGGDKSFSECSELIKPLYDWMQKNYGKYKIKRIW